MSAPAPPRTAPPTHASSPAAIAVVRRNWLRILVGVLGIYQILLALSAKPAIAVLGTVGGLLVIAAPWVPHRSPIGATVLLVVGTVPFAVVAWWSLIVPVVGLLALAIGLPVIWRVGTDPVAPHLSVSP